MARKAKSPVLEVHEIPRDTGTFDPPPPGAGLEFSLAQSATAEQVAERCRMAEHYCLLAEHWLLGRGCSRPSEGVAKAFLKDAVVHLCEVWLGLEGHAALALVRRMTAEAARQCEGKG